MRLGQAQAEFAVRYYRWALTDARREVGEGYRLLRSVRGRLSRNAVEYLERLSPIEQIEVLAARVKRFHLRAVELVGERLNDRELALLDAMDRACRVESPSDLALADRPRMSRRRFRTLVKRGCSAVLGPAEDVRQTVWFRTMAEEWTILTIVNCGSPPYYLHHIRAGERFSLHEAVSLQTWLGVGQTIWDLARAGDEATTAEAISRLCKHFIEAVPGLVAGLRLDMDHRSTGL